MYNNHRILAIIPARGGSKGIPGKNTIDLCGMPLIAYSILAAQKSQYIDRVIVSTESEVIREVALSYHADVPFLRPVKLASDTAKTIDSILYTIDTLHSLGDCYDYIVLLQPTQPIRHASFIDTAISTLIDNGRSSLVSVCPVSEHPILMRTMDSDGTLHSLLPVSSTVRRQDFPDIYRVNGSIYINRIDETLNSDTSLNDNQLAFLMKSEHSFDIDTLDDLQRTAQYIKDTHFAI